MIWNIYIHPIIVMASKVNEGATGSKGVKKEHGALTLMKNRDFKNAADNLDFWKSVYCVMLCSGQFA
jgi:hypothetical protein